VRATRALPLAFVILVSLLASLIAPPAAMADPGVPDHLAFGQQPTDVKSGIAIAPAVTVQVLDSDGNLVPDPVNVTVSLSGGDPNATLGGTTTQATSGGVATFSDLTVDKVGTSYVLTASLPDFSAVQPLASDPFDVTPGDPASLKFDQQPTDTAAGAVITPSVTVDVLDGNGNLVTDQSVDVTVVLSGGDPNAGLGGTPTQSSVNGVATFDDLTVDKVGTGYLLKASSGILNGDTSAPFDVSAGSGTHLKFDVQPSDVVAGQAIAPAVTVKVLDAEGNLVQDPTDVTVALSGGNPDATLGGHKTQTSVNGVATFDDLTVNLADTGYTLMASSGSLQTDTSSAFAVTPGAIDHIGFVTQPVSTPAKTVMPKVVVAVEDQFDNPIPNPGGQIHLSIGQNPSGGTLSGLTSQAPGSDGLAGFNNLSIDKPGTNYTLRATALKLHFVDSVEFNIQGPTTVTFSARPDTIGYGSRVTLSAHITACLNPCELSIWRRAAGTTTLVATARVDSNRNLVYTRAPGVNTSYWATFAGDDRYFKATSPRTLVDVHILIRDEMGGTGQAGHSGPYQLFHYSSSCAGGHGASCPFLRATPVPDKDGKQLRFTLEGLVNGRWQTLSVGHADVLSNGNAVLFWVYGGRSVIGVHLRTRAAYAGDAQNSGEANGPWRYFRIVS
jgi:hypothetical protein